MKLNFESADYFSYFFRSKTGINPLSYRKEIEKQREKCQEKLALKRDLDQNPVRTYAKACPSISSQQRKVE